MTQHDESPARGLALAPWREWLEGDDYIEVRHPAKKDHWVKIYDRLAYRPHH